MSFVTMGMQVIVVGNRAEGVIIHAMLTASFVPVVVFARLI